MSCVEEKVTFRNKDGIILCGIIKKPYQNNSKNKKNQKFPVVVFSHGLNSGKDSSRNNAIADSLLGKGIGSFLIDFTGHGESEGLISADLVNQQVNDLEAAINFIESKSFTAKIAVSGSSLGGTVAIIKAAKDKRVKSLVLRSPVPDHTFDAADKIKIPVLIVQGELDEEIMLHSKELVKHLRNGRLEIIKGASHLYENPKDFKEMVDKTVNFFADTLSNRKIIK